MSDAMLYDTMQVAITTRHHADHIGRRSLFQAAFPIGPEPVKICVPTCRAHRGAIVSGVIVARLGAFRQEAGHARHAS
jgi:glyoxylase-like metal-dependent hydrolase (beta-lactamase superfamily II)